MTTTLITKLHGEDLFDSLDSEEPQELREFKSNGNSNLVRMMKTFSETPYGTSSPNGMMVFFDLTNTCKNYKKALWDEITAQDISLFSRIMGGLPKIEPHYKKLTMFLSALVNENSKQGPFTIYTRHLDNHEEYRNLGFDNIKDLIIEGDCGSRVGYWMQGGTLTVNGNVSSRACQSMERGEVYINGNSDYDLGYAMTGGVIIVKGITGNQIGNKMSGGKIVLDGDCGKDVGCEMEGGEIHLNGDYESLAGNIEGGDIYHRGKQIVRNGKLIK